MTSSYAPEIVPSDLNDPLKLQAFLDREFKNISKAMDSAQTVALDPQFVAPAKPDEGVVYYADGTSWNPTGQGEGYYGYVNGSYIKLSLSSTEVNALILASMTQFIGCVLDFGGIEANIPALWLPCFGQSLLRAGTYAPLFAKIDVTYGAVDGTHFNVPDYRGRVAAGQDDMGGTSANRLTGLSGGVDGDILGGTGGLETHTLTIAQLAAHAHDVERGAGAGAVARLQAAATFNAIAVQLAAAQSVGSNGAHNNVQPTIIVNKIIYAGA